MTVLCAVSLTRCFSDVRAFYVLPAQLPLLSAAAPLSSSSVSLENLEDLVSFRSGQFAKVIAVDAVVINVDLL